MDIADFDDPYGVFGKKIIRHSPARTSSMIEEVFDEDSAV